MASRFTLPLYFVAVLLMGGVLACATARFDWLPKLLALLWGVYLVGWFFPVVSNRYHTSTNMVQAEVEWTLAEVGRMPEVPRLIIDNKSTMHWLCRGVPAIMIDRARPRLQQVAYHMRQGTFHEVLVIQVLRPTSKDGDFAVDVADVLPPEVRMETVAIKRLGGRMTRISRMLFPLGPLGTEGQEGGGREGTGAPSTSGPGTVGAASGEVQLRIDSTVAPPIVADAPSP